MSTVTSRSWMIPAAVTPLIGLVTTIGGRRRLQPNQDTLGALPVEVRVLRSSIEQMASVGSSIQPAMGRRSPASRRAGRKSISGSKNWIARSRAVDDHSGRDAERVH